MDLEKMSEQGLDLIMNYGPKLLMAVAFWIIGSWIIKILLKGADKVMQKSKYEDTLKKFLLNLITWTLKVVLIISVLGTLGVETTSFAAILASAGLAVGLALQGSLSNFAAFYLGTYLVFNVGMNQVMAAELFKNYSQNSDLNVAHKISQLCLWVPCYNNLPNNVTFSIVHGLEA